MKKYVSRVYGNGAVIIPKKVREVLKIEPGDIIIWKIDRKNNVAILSVEKDILSNIHDMSLFKGKWTEKIYRDYMSIKKTRK